jgi:hypothetical protein
MVARISPMVAAKLVTLRKTNPSETLLIAGLKQSRFIFSRRSLPSVCQLYRAALPLSPPELRKRHLRPGGGE